MNSFRSFNDTFIYDNASTARDQYVNWRAYDPNAILKEPGLSLHLAPLTCAGRFKLSERVLHGSLSDAREPVEFLL